MKGIEVSKVVFIVCLACSIGLCVAGFILPPTGVIDGSVLTAVGELLGFATIGQLPSLIKRHSVEIQHGKTKVKLSDDEIKNDIEEEINDVD